MTNAELAILSLIAETPRHGYDIETTIEQRGMRDWTEIGFSSIYYILNKLEKDGYITSTHTKGTRGGGRKIYQITDNGLATLHTAIIEALSIPKNPYPSFLLGLANLPLLTDDEISAALQTYADTLAAQHKHLQNTLPHPMLPFVEAMFSYSLAMLSAELHWVNDYRKGFAMSKLDLKKEPFYKPKKLEILDIPPMNFLMIDGIGNPNTHQAFSEAVESLFSVSYTLKFMTKSLVDYTVMPLEGLWWADDMDIFLPDTENKDNWQWTVMIRQPDHLTPNHIHAAIEAAQRKKDLAVLPRFETYHEGLSAQLMHLGPYSEEGPTIAKLHAFINAQGYALSGKHHEIYLSDSRRTAPEKMRTILRQPIQKGG